MSKGAKLTPKVINSIKNAAENDHHGRGYFYSNKLQWQNFVQEHSKIFGKI
jgi:hypothetical protein